MSGSYWQAMLFRASQPAIVQETVREIESALEIPSPPTTEEEKLAAAMEDPDFKRVHDFLARENPMQMNLDAPKSSKTEKIVPFSERPPIQFTPSE